MPIEYRPPKDGVQPPSPDNINTIERNPRPGITFMGDSGKEYTLTFVPQADYGVVCTCPGFSYRGTCKHVQNPEEYIGRGPMAAE